VFTKSLLASIGKYTETNKLSLDVDTDRIVNDASNNSVIVECIQFRGNVFNKSLPSNDMGLHIQHTE
jgi:hypothetical protein